LLSEVFSHDADDLRQTVVPIVSLFRQHQLMDSRHSPKCCRRKIHLARPWAAAAAL